MLIYSAVGRSLTTQSKYAAEVICRGYGLTYGFKYIVQ